MKTGQSCYPPPTALVLSQQAGSSWLLVTTLPAFLPSLGYGRLEHYGEVHTADGLCRVPGFVPVGPGSVPGFLQPVLSGVNWAGVATPVAEYTAVPSPHTPCLAMQMVALVVWLEAQGAW